MSRSKPLLGIALAGTMLGGIPVARAAPRTVKDDVPSLSARVAELEAKVGNLDQLIAVAPSAPEAAERRLIDGQVLYELKSYDNAAVIFLDVTEKWPGSSAASEALYYLADSLYKQRDYLSARRYFEKLLSLGNADKHYQEALERLIDISLETGDASHVDDYLARLDALPDLQRRPSVPYVRGKYFFFRQRWTDAIAVLGGIPHTSPFYLQAQYLLGASYVGQGKLPDAVTVFLALSKEDAPEGKERIIELANMALGRLFYTLDQIPGALAAYQKIDEKSDLYPEALYEQAWASIKARDYQKAWQALDLFLTVQPDGPLVPEVRLLIGDLRIRQAKYSDATDAFTHTRDEFEAIRKDLDAKLAGGSTSVAFFRDLVAKHLDNFNVSTILPQDAAQYVAPDKDFARVSVIAGDVSELQTTVDGLEDILHRVERAIDGPSRINVFPDLAQARTRAAAINDELLDIENRLQQHEMDLVGPVAGSDKATLDQLALQRRRLEEQLAGLPQGSSGYLKRIAQVKSDYDVLDKRVSELNVLIASYRAERVAIEKFFHDTDQDHDPTVRATFEQQLADVKSREQQLQDQYEQLRKAIADAASSVGVDDAQMQEETRLKGELNATLDKEHELLTQVEGRLSGADRGAAEDIDAVIVRARKVRDAASAFDARLDGVVDDRLKGIRVEVAEEKAHLAEYQQALGGVRGDTSQVGGEVAAASYQQVANRFYQVVVRSDVGILDVAWALKQTQTDKDSRLVREKKRELKMLDDDFKEVLKD